VLASQAHSQATPGMQRALIGCHTTDASIHVRLLGCPPTTQEYVWWAIGPTVGNMKPSRPQTYQNLVNFGHPFLYAHRGYADRKICISTRT